MKSLFNKIAVGKFGFKKPCSAELKDLLAGLLNPKPQKRFSIREIIRHPWLRMTDPMTLSFLDSELKNWEKSQSDHTNSDTLKQMSLVDLLCLSLNSSLSELALNSTTRNIELFTTKLKFEELIQALGGIFSDNFFKVIEKKSIPYDHVG